MTYNLTLIVLTMLLAMATLTLGAWITSHAPEPRHATRYTGKHSPTRAIGIR